RSSKMHSGSGSNDLCPCGSGHDNIAMRTGASQWVFFLSITSCFNPFQVTGQIPNEPLLSLDTDSSGLVLRSSAMDILAPIYLRGAFSLRDPGSGYLVKVGSGSTALLAGISLPTFWSTNAAAFFWAEAASAIPAPDPTLVWIPPGTFLMGSPLSE